MSKRRGECTSRFHSSSPPASASPADSPGRILPTMEMQFVPNNALGLLCDPGLHIIKPSFALETFGTVSAAVDRLPS